MDPSDSQPLLAELSLAMVKGIGPRLRQNLNAAFGDAASILQQSATQLAAVDGIGPTLARRIADEDHSVIAQEELDRAAKHGFDIMTPSDPSYPRSLRETPDPPPVLYQRGSLLAEDALSVAMVGTRHASRYGLAQAERLAAGLASQGITVVSGLARGIDTAAHRGALEAGGRTIAVLGSGLMKMYPPENAELSIQISQSGAVLSEAPLLRPPMAGAFPQRNRVISGLTLGTIVIEAADRSGSLITARHAYEQGREVFALPGPVDSRLSRGCHALIRDGATLVQSVDDVLEQLGPLIEAVPRASGPLVRNVGELKLNEVELAVLGQVATEPTLIDSVVEASGLPVHQVLATISVLEMRGILRRVSGALVARV